MRVRGKKERGNKPRCVVSEKERGREKARRKIRSKRVGISERK